MDVLLNTKQAARYLGVSSAFLERDRWAGAKIPFIKLGTRSVRYRIKDIENFINQRVRRSTSEADS
jgi:predicted DNA-binding transcriptional regulator AlpA